MRPQQRVQINNASKATTRPIQHVQTKASTRPKQKHVQTNVSTPSQQRVQTNNQRVKKGWRSIKFPDFSILIKEKINLNFGWYRCCRSILCD